MAIITDLSDSEYLGACCLCGGSKQVGVGVEDLLLIAELEPWIHQLRPSGDHDNPRPGANLHLVQADAGHYPDVARAKMITFSEQPSACFDVFTNPTNVLSDDAWCEDLDVARPTIGVLVRDDGVGTERNRRPRHDLHRGSGREPVEGGLAR